MFAISFLVFLWGDTTVISLKGQIWGTFEMGAIEVYAVKLPKNQLKGF